MKKCAIIWVVTVITSVYFTWDYTKAKGDQERLTSVERAIRQQKALDEQIREIEVAAAEREQDTRVEYRDRIEKVTEYVEITDNVRCLDPDGVSKFNALSSGMPPSN